MMICVFDFRKTTIYLFMEKGGILESRRRIDQLKRRIILAWISRSQVSIYGNLCRRQIDTQSRKWPPDADCTELTEIYKIGVDFVEFSVRFSARASMLLIFLK